MSIDQELYQSPAMRGDIAGTTISVTVALLAIADALAEIKNGRSPTEEQILRIREQARRLDGIFDRLTGYVGDN